MLSRLLLLIGLFLAGAYPAVAEEYIRSYQSDIAIDRDGGLTVAETIIVNAEGVNIRRGIFRDFPLTMRDAGGHRVHVGFDMVSVTRDGQPEEWRTESISGGIRIYAGSKDVVLARGQHRYVLTYRTNRQIRFFDDHDELYLNVTGNGWQFRIATASARVELPQGASTGRLAAYTGAAGSTESNARMSRDGGSAVFSTTRSLAPQEGLTVVVDIPKGVIAPPSDEQQRGWWLRDNITLILGPAGLGLVLVYYVWFWRKVGRDPARGVVVPRWDAPEGLSPALVNYIDNRGFAGGGWTAFSASALDLAVSGYLVLEDLKDAITLRRTDKRDTAGLPVGQAVILRSVDDGQGRFVISSGNGVAVQSAGNAFRKAIEKEHSGKYYHSNFGYVALGVVLSILAVIAIAVFGDFEPEVLSFVIMSGFLSVFFGLFAVKIGRRMRKGRSIAARIVLIVVFGIFGLVLLSAAVTAIAALLSDVDIRDHGPMFVSLTGIVLINAIFFFLMGAPTPLGRKLMDGIEGLRLYLTVAEKDRMNMAGAPKMSPQHFEKLLPYAVALGVEKPWSRAFETWLAAAGAGAAYSAAWYAGSDYSNFGDRIGGFSSSMASTIASTLPAPTSSSSSGFSGGSSGGGGGGGGGGGW